MHYILNVINYAALVLVTTTHQLIVVANL